MMRRSTLMLVVLWLHVLVVTVLQVSMVIPTGKITEVTTHLGHSLNDQPQQFERHTRAEKGQRQLVRNVSRPTAKLLFEKNVTSKFSVRRNISIESTKPEYKLSVNGTEFTFNNQPPRPLSCKNCFRSEFPILLENNTICQVGSDLDPVDVIMVIFTTHAAKERRDTIRDTWASVTRHNTAGMRHVFVLGRSHNATLMRMAELEQKVHGDILMVDFADTYNNLTLKTLSALRWIVNNCGHARFFLKADDDTWVNTLGLMGKLNKYSNDLDTAIGGHCHYSAQPVRDNSSKSYTPVNIYPQEYYPGFCSGPTYVSSLNMARKVVSVSADVPFFFLEDVYLSLCVQNLGKPYRLKRIRGFFIHSDKPCVLKTPHSVSKHPVYPAQLKTIWETKCCRVRLSTRQSAKCINCCKGT